MSEPDRRDNTLLNHVIDIKTELAKNTAETSRVGDELRTLNGKVAGHETRLQHAESSFALTAKSVSELQDLHSKADDKKSALVSKLTYSLMITGAIAAWSILKYLINTGIIKDLLK